MMRNMANLITVSRMFFALLLLCANPFSTGFWIFYALAGASDLLDGIAARSLKQESELGAKLDSIADVVFMAAIAIVIVSQRILPSWLWFWVGIIAIVRLTAYAIGYFKYHTFSALHTYLNKITGLLLFAIPVLIVVFGSRIALLILGSIAFLSAAEELLITIKAKKLNRDCKSLFLYQGDGGVGTS